MTSQQLTTIQLTEEDVLLFREFQKNYEPISMLCAGNIKSNHVEVHFDEGGNIRKILLVKANIWEG